MLNIASLAKINQNFIGHCRQREGFIEFVIRQQAAVTTDGRPEELELYRTVENYP